MDDTKAHLRVAAASPHPDKAPEAFAEPAAEMRRGRVRGRLERRGRGRGGQRLDQPVSGERQKVGMARESSKGREC